MVATLAASASMISMVAYADSDTKLDQRAEKIGKSLEPIAQDSSAEMRRGSLVIYRGSDDTRGGIAAGLQRAVRFKNFLFLYTELNNGPALVTYITDQGAETALRALEKGKSIDVSECMVPDRCFDYHITGNIRQKTCSLKMDCNELAWAPVVSSPEQSLFKTQDIEKDPLVDVIEDIVVRRNF